MTRAEEIDLQQRIARFIADSLAVPGKEEPPLLRLLAAHEAAWGIIARAKESGTPLENLAFRLARLESTDYEI